MHGFRRWSRKWLFSSTRFATSAATVFEDHASGAKTDRPGLTEALAYVREGDVLIIWKLDRLARSLPHLIETMSQLEKNGAGLQSLTEAIDTTTPGGRLIFHVFGALGQFERDFIRERTRAGLAAAASRGRRGGRKPVVTADKLLRAKAYASCGRCNRDELLPFRFVRLQACDGRPRGAFSKQI
jgi:DNA invertase Pin-like site-specific DNA recombinase